MRCNASLCCFLLSIVVTSGVSAQMLAEQQQTEINQVWPENHQIRQLREDVIFAPVSEALSARPRIYEQIGQAHRVQMEVRSGEEYFYQLFLNEEDYRFPVYSRGSYVIKRDMNGHFIQVKIFLGYGPGCYLRVFPYGTRSRMDLHLFERKVHEGVVLPLLFDRVLTEPFSRIVELSRGIVDWDLLVPRKISPAYERVQNVVKKVRELLPSLRDVDDGALDVSGDFVFIDSEIQQDVPGGFNCSGFAKWVADGIHTAITGKLLSLPELKSRHTDQRGNRWSNSFENERDPFFGLDWTRNIAVNLQGLEKGRGGADPESADVREIPFLRYIEDVGYPVEEVPLLLLYLAVKEPGYMYFASVNKEFGRDPVLRQHTHVAVFLPFFNRTGAFEPVIFERNVETSMEDFLRRNAGNFVHLVRVRAHEVFTPPEIE